MDGTASWLSFITILLTFVAQAWASEPRVVCYYTNWSVYRPGTAKFNPQNINPYLCTHLIYAFGGFTKDNTLKPFDKYQDIEKGGYAKFTGLKTYNKNLKTILAIGGWNEGSTRFSPMVSSRDRRKEFVRNAIKFLRQNRFDGLDLDWEYPAFRDGGKPKDRENYAKLVKELREEFERESEKTGRPRLLLTMAVPAGIEYIQKGFDVKTLNRYLDWMNLLTYDYHSAFEPAVNHHAPLYSLEEPNEYSVDNELNIDYTIKFYLENGADRDKLVLGIPTYGRSYTLFNPDATEIGAPADGPGEQGEATREKGYLAYYEICEALKQKPNKKRSVDDSEESDEESEEEEEEEPWTIMHPNPKAMGPVAFKGNQWVGYDDVAIVQKKAEYVAENGLGGIMFWSIDNDDFRGNCHDKPYPLIEAAKEAYIHKVGATDNVVLDKPKPVSSSSSRRRNRPRSSTTVKPTTTTRAKQNNKKKNSPATQSTTPSWNINTPEPPTTPDPGSDFKCVDEGFYPHPRDCKKYFWCLDSGPSNLGIVAHQFTCPSGLFFNKAADSCDFARNVLCKKPSATTKAPTTSKPSTTRAPTTTESTTTRRPIKLSTRNSILFRSTTTTTATPVEEEDESEEEVEVEQPQEEVGDVDAEDPRVIKELIDLIKKVGGVEQLEKHLHLAETSMSTGNEGTTTPTSFNKKLYQKVLERTRGKNKYLPEINQSAQNSRRGPQNAGLEVPQEAGPLRKERPQYTTINRSKPSTTIKSEETIESREVESEGEEKPQLFRSRDEESDVRVGTTAKPLQYVNIRRARPTTLSTSDTADDSASRNALFERNEPITTISETPSILNVIGSKRESIPEYVTIRRQRPTIEDVTTAQYKNTDLEEQSESSDKETSSLITSPPQPQYTSIVRSRSTTSSPPSEEPFEPLISPEPTTVLAVQISSLLNSPISTEANKIIETEEPSVETTLVTEPPSSPSTTTVSPRSTSTTRRNVFKRRGSTTSTTQASTSTTTSQVSSEKPYGFVRRRRPLIRPNEITLDSDDISRNAFARKIRSTTPDSREGLDIVKPKDQIGQNPRRYSLRSHQNVQTKDTVPAAATTVSRGQFRPHLSRDELISLTPIDTDRQEEVPGDSTNHIDKRYRPKTFSTVADTVDDSEVSAATIEFSRPNLISRGRGRYTLSTKSPSSNDEQNEKRSTLARFTPRPFTRSTLHDVSKATQINTDDENDEILNTPTPRSPYIRPRFTKLSPGLQGRKVPYPLNRSTSSTEDEPKEEDDEKVDDITLSESIIEEKEHTEITVKDHEDLPKKRVIIKKIRLTNSGYTNTASVQDIKPTEPITTDVALEGPVLSKQPKFKIIRRRPTSTISAESENVKSSSSVDLSLTTSRPIIRRIIRKKLRQETEPDSTIQNYLQKNIEKVETEEETTEHVVNYGEKSKSSHIVSTSETSTLTDSLITQSDANNTDPKEYEVQLVETKSNGTSETSTEISLEDKPDVIINNEQSLDVSAEKEEIELTTSDDEVTTTETITTSSTTQRPSSTSRARLPYRPPKRLYTLSTEAPTPSSTRTYSRKYNSRAYTSPSTIERTSDLSRPSLSRRPLFTSRPYTRKLVTTARTTPKLIDEEEYDSEEVKEVPEEQSFEVLPENQFFTRKPDNKHNDDDDEEEDDDDDDVENDDDSEEYESDEKEFNQNKYTQSQTQGTSRKPLFKPKTVNSNTFRTSFSTTELPRQQISKVQNLTSLYNRFKNVNETKKRVQNIPVGYNFTKTELETENDKSLNLISKYNNSNVEDTMTTVTEEMTSTTSDNLNDDTVTDDDYLTFTESTDTTTFDTTNTDNNTTIYNEDITKLMDIDETTDDYLEFTDDTTVNPSTTITANTDHDQLSNNDNLSVLSVDVNNEIYTTTEKSDTEVTTDALQVAPIVKTQFDKLFSVSRVVEVSSKLDKHRINKNNESRLIESGEIMQERKPTEDKIGEVSRFSLIKIVEDEIPIYLTKLGHVYPVDNPPDNPIRIDEARNARALFNFADSGKENLLASESINEAYRHIQKVTNKSNENATVNVEVEHLPGDDFLTYVNEEKPKNSANVDSNNDPTYWQFVPAAYENEKNKLNKAAKSFEIITPRNALTDPSTISLEGLFKTDRPLSTMAKESRKSEQPFVVYSSSTNDGEMPNIVKLQVLKTDTARQVKTYVKGEELDGASPVEDKTVKYPVYVSILSKETEVSTAPTVSSTQTTQTTPTEKETNDNSSILPVTESTTLAATTVTFTTETISEEITTQKISLIDSLNENAKKRPKFAFPRRTFKAPITTKSPISTTSPRTIKKLSPLVSANSNLKTNKSHGFNPSKSRFSANRAQNVPIDLKNAKKSDIAKSKNFTTESSKLASTTTERKLSFKPVRPILRPAFVPRRTTPSPTTQTTTKRQRPNFLRRTKATAPPIDATESSDNDLTTEFSTIVENTTNRYTRRGPARFKPKTTTNNKSEVNDKNENDRRPPSANASAQKSEPRKPTRAVVRRRFGGANGTTSTTSTTQAAISSTRRPFRIASRRRPVSKSTTSTTTSTTPASTVQASEEFLQNIEDDESIEEPSLDGRKAPQKKTIKVQRRPLTSLKDNNDVDLKDQKPAPTDEQSKRQSKKYSSSFKQNQLDEALRQKSQSQEVNNGSTDATLTSEDLSAETAIALATHQLLAAPLPSTIDYDDESTTKKQTTKKNYSSPKEYEYNPEDTEQYEYPTTDAVTGTRIIYTSSQMPSGYSSTPSYASTSRNPIPSEPPRQSTPSYSDDTISSRPSTPSYFVKGIQSNSVGYSGVSQPQLGPSTSKYLGTSDKYLTIPIEEIGYSTEGFTGGFSQEPVYFTREYLLESPVTRTYDDEYQYLSPLTLPKTTTRKASKKNVFKRISTTQRPTTSLPVITPGTTPKPRRIPQKKPFEKIAKIEPKRTYQPIENYDYYDDSNEKVVGKYAEGTQVVVHGKGNIECLDIGNFPHPTSCKKFISCARMESGAIMGWEYVCPKGLSFDPVGSICNWSAGLGCNES